MSTPARADAPLVALQLYTLRSLVGGGGLDWVLDRVAALGYEGVELAGLHGAEPARIRERCDRLGLELCGAHVEVERLEAAPRGVAGELHALGLDTIVFPSLPGGPGKPDAAVARLASAAGLAAEHDLRPVFHNHADELRRAPDGSRTWEGVLAIDELRLELDLGWAWAAGESPAGLLERCGSRVELVHVKDLRTDGTHCPVGEGAVGYRALLPEVAALGVRRLVVEQDEPGDDPLGAAARSLAAVRAALRG